MKDFFIGVSAVLLGITIGIVTIFCIIVGIEHWHDLYHLRNWTNKHFFKK